MKHKYNFYCYYKDIRVGRYKCHEDNYDSLYNEMSKQLIKDAFLNGVNYKQQIQFFKVYCDKISNMVNNCYKVRASDFLMFLSCYVALIKYNEIPETDYLFMKRRNKVSLKTI